MLLRICYGHIVHFKISEKGNHRIFISVHPWFSSHWAWSSLRGRRLKDKKEVVEPEADPERDQRTVFAYQVDGSYVIFMILLFDCSLFTSNFYHCLLVYLLFADAIEGNWMGRLRVLLKSRKGKRIYLGYSADNHFCDFCYPMNIITVI